MLGIRDGEYMGRAAPPDSDDRGPPELLSAHWWQAGSTTWTRQTAAPTARTSLCAHAEGKRVGPSARAVFRRNTLVETSCQTEGG